MSEATPDMPVASKSIFRCAVDDTLKRWGARVGLFWLAVVTFFAIFAPLIASSHPILMKMDGEWFSPMLRHLTPADVILLITTAAGAVLWPLRKIRLKVRWGLFVGIVGLATVICLWTVTVPKPIKYDQARKWQAAGELEKVYWTLIPYSPSDLRQDVYGDKFVGPSSEHWLGTESKGRDVLSRMMHASRIAMAIGFIATGIALVIGVVLGALMGYFSRAVDLIGMRLVEIFEMIPTLFLLLMCVAFFGRNLYIMMAIIGLTSWTSYARFTRAEFLKLRKQDFVQAATACGLPLRSILFRHMLPNGMTPVLVSASFGVASAILYEATLSFLGLGLIEEPSWGQMLSESTGATGTFKWWMAIYPGLAIFLTVFAYNLIGEALRDAIDPHSKKTAHL
jgi:peptide/nickel transport system permease protein